MRESAAQKNFVVRLDNQRTDETIRSQSEIDGRIDGTIRVHTGDSVTGHPIGEAELPTQQNLIIDLESEGQHSIACARTGCEGSVGGPVWVQAGDVAPGNTINIGEETSNEDVFIRLQEDGAH